MWPSGSGSIFVLADGDAVGFALSVLNFGGTVILTIIMFVINGKTRRIDTLEAEVKKGAEDSIGAKFEALRAQVEVPIKIAAAQISDFTRRLDEGEEIFRALGNADHKLELGVHQRVAELQRTCVTKDDFEHFKRTLHEDFRKICQSVEELGRKLAVREERDQRRERGAR